MDIIKGIFVVLSEIGWAILMGIMEWFEELSDIVFDDE